MPKMYSLYSEASILPRRMSQARNSRDSSLVRVSFCFGMGEILKSKRSTIENADVIVNANGCLSNDKFFDRIANSDRGAWWF